MVMSKTARIISTTVYGIGVAIALILGCVTLFGPTEFINPDAMLPVSRREQAFFGLSVGAVPMLLACIAMYKFNSIKDTSHKRRNFVLIFLPGFLCAACTLYWIVIIAIGYINMFLHWGS
jgi:uncharacterized membrane protein